MAKKEFKTIEEATKAYGELEAKHEAEEKSHEATKNELKQAQEVAKDAIDKANEAIEKSDPNTYATVKGSKYIINFGVDGLTKDQLKRDGAKLSKLVNLGSGALTKVNQ